MKPRILLPALLSAAMFVIGPTVRAETIQPPSLPYADDDVSIKFVAGSVTAKSEKELTVKPATGDAVTVKLTDATKYSKNGDDAKADAVSVGGYVLVSYKLNDDGDKEAVKVSVTEAPEP